MINRFVPVFSCPRLDEADISCNIQPSHWIQVALALVLIAAGVKVLA
jgi:hypothetical protein